MPPAPARRRPPASALLALVLAGLTAGALAPAPASARGGRDARPEVRVSGDCGAGARAKLRLRADDGAIEVEFEVDERRIGTAWRVTLVRERRVVARVTARTHGPSGSFTVTRRLRDLAGADRVTARASGPGGLTCQAAATLPA